MDSLLDAGIQFKPKHTKHDSIGFVGDHIEQVVHFDFDAVDARLTRGKPLAAELEQPAQDSISLAANGFREILQWTWRDGCESAQAMRGAFVKFTAMTATLRPEILADLTFGELAENIGITKAALSKQSVNFSDIFGIKMPRSRSKASRQNMALARIKNFQKKQNEIQK